jgi:hypothetical protein
MPIDLEWRKGGELEEKSSTIQDVKTAQGKGSIYSP